MTRKQSLTAVSLDTNIKCLMRTRGHQVDILCLASYANKLPRYERRDNISSLLFLESKFNHDMLILNVAKRISSLKIHFYFFIALNYREAIYNQNAFKL